MRATLLALLAACRADQGPAHPGGQDPPPPTTAEGCAVDPVADPAVQDVFLFCDAAHLSVDVCVSGWTSSGLLWLTGPTVEEHDLHSAEFDPDGRWDRLFGTLRTGAGYERDASTALSCDGSAAALTYALLVVDADGEPADCVAHGPVPEVAAAYGCHDPPE